MAELKLADVTKRYSGHSVIDRVGLSIPRGELLALLGPSGCGKTTLLRLIAGFERLDEGEISFDGRPVSASGIHLPPEQRKVGMVFQSYALWPHMSVLDNVAYPLRVARAVRAAREQAVAAALAQVGMQGFEQRAPAELSGGQRQRVALARCLVMRASIVLLDEPLANLDVHLRETMQGEFRRFHRETGATMVYVTHDQAEAMALADRIAVLDRGVLQQVDNPRALYREPATAMVAEFVGRGMLVPAKVLGPDGPGVCCAELLDAKVRLRCGDTSPGAALACLRTEQLEIAEAADSCIAARVVDSIYRGPVTTLVLRPRSAEQCLLQVDVRTLPPAIDTEVHIAVRDGWRVPGPADAGTIGNAGIAVDAS